MIYSISNENIAFNEEDIFKELLSEDDDNIEVTFEDSASILNEAMVYVGDVEDEKDEESEESDNKPASESKLNKVKEWLLRFLNKVKEIFINLISKISDAFKTIIAKLGIMQKVSAEFYNKHIEEIKAGIAKDNWRATGNVLLLATDPSTVYHKFSLLLVNYTEDSLKSIREKPWAMNPFGKVQLQKMYDTFNDPMKFKTEAFFSHGFHIEWNPRFSPNFPKVNDLESFKEFVMCIIYHENSVANADAAGHIALEHHWLIHEFIKELFGDKARQQMVEILQSVVNDTQSRPLLNKAYIQMKSEFDKSIRALKEISSKWEKESKKDKTNSEINIGIKNIQTSLKSLITVSDMQTCLYYVCARAIKDRLKQSLRLMKVWYEASKTDSVVYAGNLSKIFTKTTEKMKEKVQKENQNPTNESLCFFNKVYLV